MDSLEREKTQTLDIQAREAGAIVPAFRVRSDLSPVQRQAAEKVFALAPNKEEADRTLSTLQPVMIQRLLMHVSQNHQITNDNRQFTNNVTTADNSVRIDARQFNKTEVHHHHHYRQPPVPPNIRIDVTAISNGGKGETIVKEKESGSGVNPLILIAIFLFAIVAVSIINRAQTGSLEPITNPPKQGGIIQ